MLMNTLKNAKNNFPLYESLLEVTIFQNSLDPAHAFILFLKSLQAYPLNKGRRFVFVFIEGKR